MADESDCGREGEAEGYMREYAGLDSSYCLEGAVAEARDSDGKGPGGFLLRFSSPGAVAFTNGTPRFPVAGAACCPEDKREVALVAELLTDVAG